MMETLNVKNLRIVSRKELEPRTTLMARIRERKAGGTGRFALVTLPSLLALPEERSRRDAGTRRKSE